MKGLIRWSYVAPRLLGLSAVVLLIYFGLDPALRWSLIFTGQTMIGAQVNIDELDSSLSNCQLTVKGIQIANPKATDRNLVEVKSVRLLLDSRELLKRRFVVRKGKMSGVRLNRPREKPGEIDRSAPGVSVGKRTPWTDRGGQILKTLALTATDGPLTANWEVVTVSQELRADWQAEYDEISSRLAVLQEQIDAMSELARESQFRSLEDANRLQNALQRAGQLRADLTDLRHETQRLRARIPTDKQQMLVAKEHDQERIEQIAKLARLDGQTLTEYLLGPEYANRVRRLASWIEWGRQHMPVQRDLAAPSRMRGRFVSFRGTSRKPNLVVDSLAIDGQIDLDQGPLMFRGDTRHLTTEPRISGQPTILRFETRGAADLRIQAIVDRTGQTPIDRIRVHCPSLPQSDRVLGSPDQLALSVAPGELQLDLVIDLRGQDISGNLLLSQSSVDLVPYVGERYGGEALARRLWTTAKSVDQIEVTAHLSGTLHDPRWKLDSNIGPQLADGINHVLQDELGRRKEQLTASLNEILIRQQTKIDEQIRQHQIGLEEKLSLGQAQVDQLKQSLAGQIGFPVPSTGRDRSIGDLPAQIGRKIPRFGDFLQRSPDS